MNKNVSESLRDINLKLREQSNLRKPKNKIVFRIWTKQRDLREFHSEASTLNFFNNKWPKNKCPFCETLYGNKNLTNKNEHAWIFQCPGCKSILKVLNE